MNSPEKSDYDYNNKNYKADDDLTTIKETIVHQKTIKPEVTITEYALTKKWYEYEKKIEKDTKFTAKFMNRASFAMDKTNPMMPLSL